MSSTAPFPLLKLSVKSTWVDFNGHMNDASYAEAFSLALMTMTDHLGLDADGRARTGHTIYTIAAMIRFLHEVADNEPLLLTGRILEADDKRLRVWAEMHHAETGTLLATTEQLFLCIDQSGPTPRAARWPEPFAKQLAVLAAEHADLPAPAGAGEGIRLTQRTPQ